MSGIAVLRVRFRRRHARSGSWLEYVGFASERKRPGYDDTRPPDNLRRQPLLALAVLASKARKTLSMAELADGMFELCSLRRRSVAPDARDHRYMLLRPFKKLLHGAAPAAELDRLVETVPRDWVAAERWRVVGVSGSSAAE